MSCTKKYEKPIIEVTRFDINQNIMDGWDGDMTTMADISQPDGGPTTPIIDLDRGRCYEKRI